MKRTSVFRAFVRYTLLSVLGTLGVSCYILADTFFIAQGLGTRGLAALNLAIPVYNFIHGTGLMLGMGGATRFSICRIRGEEKRADAEYSHVVYLAAVFSLLFMAVGFFFSGQLTGLLGADEAVFEMTKTYLTWLLLFSPAFIMNDILLCFIRNDGEPRLPMFAMLVGSFANIVLDYIFIFSLQMGIFGAVFATGLSPIISMLVMSPHFLKRKNGFHLHWVHLQTELVKNSLSIGFPSLVAQVSSGIVMIIFNIIILDLEGNVGVAAYGVTANISLVVVAIYTGIAQGIQPLISESYGVGEKKRSRQVLNYGMVTMAVLSAAIYVMLFAWADPITAAFNNEENAALQEIAVQGLKLYFTSNLFVGYNTILAVYFTSVERALPAHVISILRGVVLIIPMAFLLGSLWGMTGVWLAYSAAEGISAVVGWLFQRMEQKKVKIPVDIPHGL